MKQVNDYQSKGQLKQEREYSNILIHLSIKPKMKPDKSVFYQKATRNILDELKL